MSLPMEAQAPVPGGRESVVLRGPQVWATKVADIAREPRQT